ncbi:hypothetical protein D0Z07_7713 [Hyphodiscus hymeniophilus]|uniref:Uncharacterized protein n=1 Tax=Hyphodiscus hymeniophilus TaxID=353542 RepID=A0A9P6VCI2_9HELO|nr:hypothetical protein D0Z07_7713 [Hyphodiscus hymeniophilus]
MSSSPILSVLPALPADLESIFSSHANNPLALIEAFMPVFCDHVDADRIFVQARNPDKRVCKVMRWRRHDGIPWPEIPGSSIDWFVEDHWEVEDPLWRAALQHYIILIIPLDLYHMLNSPVSTLKTFKEQQRMGYSISTSRTHICSIRPSFMDMPTGRL